MTNTTASGIAIRPASADDLPAVEDLLTKTTTEFKDICPSSASVMRRILVRLSGDSG